MSPLLLLLAAALSSVEVPAEGLGEKAVKAFVEANDRAFNAKDLGGLAELYHPDVTIFEGGHVNTGWPDYRATTSGRSSRRWRTCDSRMWRLGRTCSRPVWRT